MLVYTEMQLSFGQQEDWTLTNILSYRAATHSSSKFLSVPEQGVSYTYAETHDAAQRIATSLLTCAREGDRVLIMARNCAEYVLSWFGAAQARMIEVPINTAYKGSFLEHQVRVADPSIAIIEAEFAARFVDSHNECRSLTHFFVIGEAGDVAAACELLRNCDWFAEPWVNLLQLPPRVDLPIPSFRDPVGILFTSGTTGPSKGVTMSNAHMYFFADECVALTRLTDQDVYMVAGPLFHGNAQFLAAYPALIAGAHFVLRKHFSASRWIDWVRDDGITVTNFVGVMMDFVWKQPEKESDRHNKLRCVFAAPTAPYVEDFKERFAVEAFVEVFGLTETAMPIMTPYGKSRPVGAAGLVNADFFDVRLVDPETDQEVAVGEMGELIVRPKLPWTTTLGYYAMPEKTCDAFRNLWFHTGDGLRQDSDGWFYFVDRLKDAIRRRGENISSYEVESALLEHPAVTQCAVIAVPADQEAGEDEVLALIVTESTAIATDAVLIWAWCDDRLPAFAVPRYLRFELALPMTPSGKVQKKELRNRLFADSELYDRENWR